MGMRTVIAVGLALLVLGWVLYSQGEGDRSSCAPEDAGPITTPPASMMRAEGTEPRLAAAGQKPADAQAPRVHPRTAPDRMRLLGTYRDEAGDVVRVTKVHAELERDGSTVALALRGSQPDGNFDYWFLLPEAGGTVRLRLFAADLVPVDRTVAAVPGTLQHLAIVFLRGARLRGRVVDSAENPVAGMSVSLFLGGDTSFLSGDTSAARGRPVGRGSKVARSDEEGLFTLKGLEERLYAVHGSFPRGRPGPYGLQVQWGLTKGQQLRPEDALQTIVAHKTVWLRGHVLGKWKLESIQDGLVRGRLTFSDGQTVVTESSLRKGLYALRWTVPPGPELDGCSLELAFFARGYEPRTMDSHASVGQEFEPGLVMLEPTTAPELGSAWLEVVDAQGRPVDLDLRVMRPVRDMDYVLPGIRGTGFWRAVDAYRVPAKVRVVGKGRLQVRALVGTLHLQIGPRTRAGRLPMWNGDVTFGPGPEKWIRIVLPPMAVVEIPADRSGSMKAITLTLNRADPWGLDTVHLTIPGEATRLAVAPGTWHIRAEGGSTTDWQVLELTAGTSTVVRLR